MQNNSSYITLITPDAPMSPDTHGGRAKCLQRLVRMDMPVPTTVALSFEAVHNIAAGDMPDLDRLISPFEAGQLLCVRPSSQDPDWGGPGAVLNIGMNAERHAYLSNTLGRTAADELYFRFIQAYSVHVARLDPDMFDDITPSDANAVAEALDAYEDEADESFPQDPKEQLGGVLRSMARAWEGTSARLLRMAKGAPADAGLGLVVQSMALGLGQGECGSGVLQLVDSVSGMPMIKGRYLSQSQGRDALRAGDKSLFLEKDERGPSLEDQAPEAFAQLIEFAEAMRHRLRE